MYFLNDFSEGFRFAFFNRTIEIDNKVPLEPCQALLTLYLFPFY